MDQYIGKLLDNRYEILERVGSGGMAVVYKARCHRLNRLVAIKILKTELAQDAEFRRRFHDESQAVAMLSHPNIVAVYDVSKSTELDYIVMELIDGITLKQYMQKKGEPLNWKESLHYITQIMKALSHAHSRGIIHRDIKPHNIMILRDGSVKVADFGIARLASAAQNTLTQEALGSVHYISPEQARGSHIDARSDIYSAGVVLYEIVTGRLPYEGDSPISVAIQHINSIPLSPREVNPDIPEALEAITMKAMSANVDQRYASADAMLADLEEFRKNPNINFEYSAADLLTGADEPTQVMDTGSHNLHAAAASAARAGAGKRGPPPESAVRRRRPDDDDEYEDDYGRRRRSDRGGALPVVLAVGAILIFLVGIGYFLWATFLSGLGESTPDFEVPDLAGMSVEEANALPEMKDGTFTIEFGKTVINEGFKEGEIAFQDPAAGSKRKEGTVITVDVNSGTSKFIMDDYTATRKLSDIKLLLESKGFLVEASEIASETITQGYIISQEPAEGTELKPGDTVKLVGSTGPELKMVTVPVFINMTKDDAVKAIQSAGLIVGAITPAFDETIPDGSVVWQGIQQGSEVPEKTVIDLKVSKGPDPAPSPSPTPTESVEPSVSPSADVTPTPSPTPSAPSNEVSKAITVYLPSDKDLVHVVVKVDGVVKWDDNVSASEFSFITPAVRGLGTQTVEVYIDDVLVDTQSVDFS